MSLGANVCGLCRGRGSLMCVQAGDYEWHDCPICAGAGARALANPPTIRTHFRSLKPLRKLEHTAGIFIKAVICNCLT